MDEHKKKCHLDISFAPPKTGIKENLPGAKISGASRYCASFLFRGIIRFERRCMQHFFSWTIRQRNGHGNSNPYYCWNLWWYFQGSVGSSRDVAFRSKRRMPPSDFWILAGKVKSSRQERKLRNECLGGSKRSQWQKAELKAIELW